MTIDIPVRTSVSACTSNANTLMNTNPSSTSKQLKLNVEVVDEDADILQYTIPNSPRVSYTKIGANHIPTAVKVVNTSTGDFTHTIFTGTVSEIETVGSYETYCKRGIYEGWLRTYLYPYKYDYEREIFVKYNFEDADRGYYARISLNHFTGQVAFIQGGKIAFTFQILSQGEIETKTVEAPFERVDDEGNVVYQTNPDGSIKYETDENGNIKYDEFGDPIPIPEYDLKWVTIENELPKYLDDNDFAITITDTESGRYIDAMSEEKIKKCVLSLLRVMCGMSAAIPYSRLEM